MADHKPDIHNEVLEAVARGICLDDDPIRCADGCIPNRESKCHYADNARAALTVALDMLAEPTEEMVYVHHTCPDHSAKVRWRAMLSVRRKEILGD